MMKFLKSLLKNDAKKYTKENDFDFIMEHFFS